MQEFKETMKVLTQSKSIIGLALFLVSITILAVKGKIDREVGSVFEILAGSYFVSRSVDNFSKSKSEKKDN